MRMRNVFKSAILVSIVAIGLTVCFPPWCTPISGNSYPHVPFSWIGSPPPPTHNPGDTPQGIPYNIDEDRLLGRIIVVVLFPVILIPGSIVVSRLRRHQPKAI